MEIISDLREIPNLSIALGFFDGVHLGHQAVISCAVDYANEIGVKSAVVTFKEHPYCFFKGESPKYILTLEDKYKYFENLGVDYVFELDFASVHKMSPIQYLEDILVKYMRPKAISTGFNHKFGYDKSGSVKFLSDHQDTYGYVYFATPPQSVFGDMISSTAIRKFIKSGIMELAESMLGRKFSVKGTVIKGRELGRKIGYPTANIIYPSDIVEPPYGVYDVDVELPDGIVRRGLANFGVSPTVSDDENPVLEVYIIDFDEDIYEQEIKINFSKMIRTEIKFESLNELKLQIEADLQSLY